MARQYNLKPRQWSLVPPRLQLLQSAMDAQRKRLHPTLPSKNNKHHQNRPA